jgi:hypothetical protein
MISDYQREQIEALTMVQRYLDGLPISEIQRLQDSIRDYLQFRKDTQQFLTSCFDAVCYSRCYKTNLSACCTREGIITYFADLVINCLQSGKKEIENLIKRLQQPNESSKCIYLEPDGCMWRIKPIVCEMFICDAACREVFADHREAEAKWEELNQRKKKFIWPDQPILFDQLEDEFLNAGLFSSLMYMHTSPGLLRVKKMAGLPVNHRVEKADNTKTARKS